MTLLPSCSEFLMLLKNSLSLCCIYIDLERASPAKEAHLYVECGHQTLGRVQGQQKIKRGKFE